MLTARLETGRDLATRQFQIRRKLLEFLVAQVWHVPFVSALSWRHYQLFALLSQKPFSLAGTTVSYTRLADTGCR